VRETHKKSTKSQQLGLRCLIKKLTVVPPIFYIGAGIDAVVQAFLIVPAFRSFQLSGRSGFPAIPIQLSGFSSCSSCPVILAILQSF
jgi:hypothetical protein